MRRCVLIFRKRDRRGGAPAHVQAGVPEGPTQAEFYKIDFDMMLKGCVVKRRGGAVRQFGVTVDGSTRLVTSGDTVDRRTYQALVAAGALRVTPPTQEPLPPRDDTDPTAACPEV